MNASDSGFAIRSVEEPTPDLSEQREVCLVTAAKSLLYCSGIPGSPAELIDRLILRTQSINGLQVRRGGRPPSAGQPWGGSDSAVDTTTERLRLWMGAKRSSADAPALDTAVAGVLSGSWGMLDATTVDALARTSVDDVRSRRFGDQVLALVGIAQELDAMRCALEPSLDAFADALTAYVVAINSSMAESRYWTRVRVVSLINAFVSGTGEVHRSVRPKGLGHTESARALEPTRYKSPLGSLAG